MFRFHLRHSLRFAVPCAGKPRALHGVQVVHGVFFGALGDSSILVFQWCFRTIERSGRDPVFRCQLRHSLCSAVPCDGKPWHFAQKALEETTLHRFRVDLSRVHHMLALGGSELR